MNNKEKLQKMADIQCRLNAELDPDWKERGWNFRLALIVEVGEFAEHTGYKWWKDQKPDKSQAQLELVDMWHFILSYAMTESPSLLKSYPVGKLCENWDARPQGLNRHTAADFAVFMASESDPGGMIYEFRKLCAKEGLSFDKLYKLFVGKSTLNAFRWEHGYKTGSYVKMWEGKEDNEYLTEVLNRPEADEAEDLEAYVRQALNDRYTALFDSATAGDAAEV